MFQSPAQLELELDFLGDAVRIVKAVSKVDGETGQGMRNGVRNGVGRLTVALNSVGSSALFGLLPLTVELFFPTIPDWPYSPSAGHSPFQQPARERHRLDPI